MLLSRARWLIPVVALLDGFTYEVTSECATDPPPMPTFTAADAAIVALGFAANGADAILAKVNALILNMCWDLFCQCDAGAIATPTPLVPPPADVSQPSGNANTPCFQGSYKGSPALRSIGSPELQADDYTQATLPTDGTTLTVSYAGGTRTAHGIPTGVTQIASQGDLTLSTQGDQTVYWGVIDVFCYSAAGALITTVSLPLQTVANEHQEHIESVQVVDPTWKYWIAYVSLGLETGPYRTPIAINTQAYCGGSPTGLEACCPPDPAVMLGIQQIIQLVQSLHTTVGGTPPSSWSDGVRHTSLSGAGSFTVNPKAIGIRVEVKVGPVPPDIIPGEPTFYWNMGFITPIALSSPLRGWRLVFLTQSFELPEFTDSIGYTLLHGTIVDVVELMPVFGP